jgi:ARG and Rhodanese-Phosphatase-superfamily-associated Protein domain
MKNSAEECEKMRTKFLSTVLGLLALAVGISFGIRSNAQVYSLSPMGQAPQAGNYKITGPFTHDNLSVFLVHGKDRISGRTFLTLQEALTQKKVIVYETRSVNELAIENISNDEVYVQAGEIVKGGQQDRALAIDMIVPARSGKMPIAAFCVEHGRWTKRGSEQVTVFSSSAEVVSTKDLKLAAKSARSQGAVWQNVTVAQDKLSSNVGGRVNAAASESSLQLALENKAVQKNADEYIKALSGVINGQNDVIGYAFAINGKVNSADVYASSGLFKKLWPKLLKASAIEAIAEFSKNAKFAPVHKDAVKTFLDDSETGKAAEKSEDLTKRIQLVTRESTSNVFFETRDRAQKEVWLHRNYIKKD